MITKIVSILSLPVTSFSAQAALRITRTALDAFAVINRVDVYVLQDVKETGEETIFYLK